MVEISNPLLSVPQSYLDFSQPCLSFREMPHADAKAPKTFLKAYCLGIDESRTDDGKRQRRLRLTDGQSEQFVTDFGRGSEMCGARPNAPILLQARMRFIAGQWRLSNPDFYPAWIEGSIMPLYAGKTGHKRRIAQWAHIRAALWSETLDTAARILFSRISRNQARALQKAICQASRLSSQSPSALPSRFADYKDWLRALHAPVSLQEGTDAHAVARVFSAMDVLRRAQAAYIDTNRRPLFLSQEQIEDSVAALENGLGLQLSEAQRRAVEDLCNSLSAGEPHALLNGEVGSGKTFVFLPIAAALAASGQRIAILSPSRLLAGQTAGIARRCYPDLRPQLCMGGKKADNEKSCLQIGTQALLHDDDAKHDWVVVDEEQKLGAEQKRALGDALILDVSATPIPRTYAIARFAGRRLIHLPARSESRHITSRLHAPSDKASLFAEVCADVAAGKQVAIIYPRAVEGTQSAEQAFARWKRCFPPNTVQSIHGQMSRDQQDGVMAMALHVSSVSILIGTSILEIGITLPRLTRLVVVSPERHGMASLHQMRGRLCRQGGHGHFDMLQTDDLPKETLERLHHIKDESSGHAIAGKDTARRGYGELHRLGLLQSGKDPSPLFAGHEASFADVVSLADSILD